MEQSLRNSTSYLIYVLSQLMILENVIKIQRRVIGHQEKDSRIEQLIVPMVILHEISD